jgi:ATP-dependent Clp protease ATP-binding subunit ClpA
MFDRFDEPARQVLVDAQAWARELNHQHIGTDHFLLAVVGDAGDLPAQFLASFEINAEQIRDKLIEVLGTGTEPSPSFLAFTPELKGVFESAVDVADGLGRHQISPGILLMALIDHATEAASDVLSGLSAPVGEIRSDLRARLRRADRTALKGLPHTLSLRPPLQRVVASEHRGPPDSYLVIRDVTASQAPEEIRTMAERALKERGISLDSVPFIAEVRDAADPAADAGWLIATNGPSPHVGLIVRSTGSWAAASTRFQHGEGASSTPLRVSIVDRVEADLRR